MTIEAAIDRVYTFWLDLENFQAFVPALTSVRVMDDTRSRWVIRAPLGYEARFDSTIVEQSRPDRLVWISRHHAGHARGELTFTGVGACTRVDLAFQYTLHNTWIQEIARLVNRLGFPAQTIESGLARIKQQIEAQNATP